MSLSATNTGILVSLLISWLIPIYLVSNYADQNRALTESGSKLEKLVHDLDVRLKSLDHAISSVEVQGTYGSEKLSVLESNRNRDTKISASMVDRREDFDVFVDTDHEQPSKSHKFYKIYGLFSDQQLFKRVKRLSEDQKKRILVTGGAGFVGSHLVDSLMLDGHEVIVCDNFFTGRKSNVDHWQGHPNFELLNHDIVTPLTIEVDQIYHLASPASPKHYMFNPIKTIKVNVLGTINMLGLAKRVGARILIASTSEIYGDPEVHPQSEDYWGHANPIGPRSCYDEGKRLSESLAVAYNTRENVSIAIGRIFNTYGPRMHPDDGRVISNFVTQALRNESITIYGTGEQTRSFQYITDLIIGLKKLMESDVTSPVNLGNQEEMTINSLASLTKKLLPNSLEVVYKDLPVDDPQRRRPDISKAMRLLSWRPRVSLEVGLGRTIDYFTQEIKGPRQSNPH